MYVGLLTLHSWLRWLVLALGIALLVFASLGRHSGSEWSAPGDRLQAGFLGALDLQAVAGLALYVFLSPLTGAGTADLGAAMDDPVLRYYTIEHPFGMVVGIVVAHVGLARSKRHASALRYRAVLLTQVVWLVIALVTLPWPGLAYGRPLLRPW